MMSTFARFLAFFILLVPVTSQAAADLFVVRANGGVVRFDGTTGAFVSNFTTSGARGIALGPDLQLYVSDGGTLTVKRFNSATGAFIDDFVASGDGSPASMQDIAFGPDGNLYVCTRSTGVLRYDGATGAFLGAFAASDAQSLLFRDGFLYVTNILGDKVERFDAATGAYIDDFVTVGSGGLFRPSGLRFGLDGNLYVTSQANNVKRYDGSTGAFIDNFTSGGLSNPQGIRFGADGHLYVASTGGNQVRRFDGATGADLGTFASAAGMLPVFFLFYDPTLPISVEKTTWGKLKGLYSND